MTTRARILVSGRVQGVFYRANARERAQELGIAGYVKNLDDGSVEILAEGDEEKISKLIEWCKKGPRLAKVQNVEAVYDKATGEFSFFEILE